MSVCMSFLASNGSDRSMPQKLFCGSSDSMPIYCSSGPSCRIHWTRNLALLDPRCTTMIAPDCNCVRRAQFIRAPVGVMSTVWAKWCELIDRKLNRQHHFSARRFTSVQHWQVPASPAAFYMISVLHSRYSSPRCALTLRSISRGTVRGSPPPSESFLQQSPEASLPVSVTASPVAQICSPAKKTQSVLRGGPFSTSRFSTLPRMALCDPVR
jgi:hypothetical protein